jgi:hypothetical protein
MTASALIHFLQSMPWDTPVTVDTGSGANMVITGVYPHENTLALIARQSEASVEGQTQYQEMRKA